MPPSFEAFKGRSAALVREFDWSVTPLGPPETWRPEMKSWVEFILESRFPAAVIWRNGLVTIYNDAFAPILGDKPEAMGRSFADIWSEVWEHIGPIAERAFEGEPTYIEDYPLTINRFGRTEEACFTFCYSPLRLSDGTIVGMMDTVIETTAKVQQRRQLDLLNQELAHRLRNSMSIAKAVAAQTLKGINDAGPVRSFLHRIDAIARAQREFLNPDVCTRCLNDVLAAVLGPLDGLRQIRYQGPDIVVGPQSCLSLSMVLYELATNAAKYGALSTPDGRVDLGWNIADSRLVLSWRERGGPPAKEPTRIGFGTRLIDGGLGAGCVVHRSYPEEGFEADIRIPLHVLTQ